VPDDTDTNRGALALKLKLAKRGARAAFAKDLGIDQAVVTHWLSGERRPDSKNRARLEDDHGVPWRLWDVDVPGKEVAKVEAELLAEQEAPAEPPPTFLDPPAPTGTEGSR